MLRMAKEDVFFGGGEGFKGLFRSGRIPEHAEHGAAAAGHPGGGRSFPHQGAAGAPDGGTQTAGDRLKHIADAAAELREVAGFQRGKRGIRIGPGSRGFLPPEAEDLRGAQAGTGLNYNQPVIIFVLTVFQDLADPAGPGQPAAERKGDVCPEDCKACREWYDL